MHKRYRFMDICWEVSAEMEILQSMDKLLKDYFLETKDDEKKNDFSISIKNIKYMDLNEVLEFGKAVTIHNSKKSSVHEEGRAYRNGFINAIFNSATKSVYVLNYLSKKIDIYNADKGILYKDGIRVVRDIVKVIAEKNSSIMLHAAALFKKEYGGIILVGGKGSGKTSISLELLYKHGFEEVSRDRIMLHAVSNGFDIYGWPNYYNLTIRTMNSFTQTKCLIPKEYIHLTIQEMDGVNRKMQFTAEEIGIKQKRSVAPLRHVFYLNNIKKDSQLSKEELLAISCYTPEDLNYPNWHSWESTSRENAIILAEHILGDISDSIINWESLDDATKTILDTITVK